jgi:lambda family phage portal protein
MGLLPNWLKSTPAVAEAEVPVPHAATEIQDTRWRGASRGLRSMMTWLAAIGSAVSDLPSAEQRTLRARSRDAFRNHPIARAALTRSRTNIVGTGLMCRPSVDHETLGISADEGERLNGLLRAGWERWAEDANECDLEGTHDIYGLQALSLLSAMASGDVFALTPMEYRTGGVSGLKVQLVEADRISNPHDAVDTPLRIDGIELRNGRPLGAWIRNTHPGDRVFSGPASWKYYPFFGEETGRRRVLHVWNDKERPGQVRGAPYLAPILEPLQQLARFSNAELMAAVLSAMTTVFIERGAEQSDENGSPVEALPTDASGQVELGVGAIVDLAHGEKANSVTPGRPNAAFDPFFVAVVKQIGAALELPLDELLLAYNASYSAARAAMLQAWRFYTTRRWGLTQQFCQPIYGLHVDEEVASGRLQLPGYGDPIRRRAYTRALWIGPARGAMDEDREAKAARTRIEIGVSNEAIETAAMAGEDWNAVYAQRLREINRRKADGTYIPPRGEAPAPPPEPPPESA